MLRPHQYASAARALLREAPYRMLPGASSVHRLRIENPANTYEVFSAVDCNAADVYEAVGDARGAFTGWAAARPKDRADVLRKTVDGLKEAQPLMAAMESLNTGKPFREALGDVDECIKAFSYSAHLAEQLDSAVEVPADAPDIEQEAWVRKEALGVVGAICPWNYPAMMAAWKVAPALAAGCTVVVKPSELTPFTTIMLGEIMREAGLPDGCLRVVPGGREAGATLSSHPDIAKLSFTGSGPTGAAVMRAATERFNPVTLELGGKSAAIITESADIDAAMEWILFGGYWNAGQICSATSRILVPRRMHASFVERLVTAANALTVGPPLQERNGDSPDDDDFDMGPVISRAQLDKVKACIAAARAEGNQCVAGGTPVVPDAGSPLNGHFLSPTVFRDVGPSDTLWRTEVFGPVLSTTPYDSIDEAVALAENTPYGLAAAVFSGDDDEMRSISRRLRVGTVWENCSQPVSTWLPWGGFKESGIGREMGAAALEPFLEDKAIIRQPEPGKHAPAWFSMYR